MSEFLGYNHEWSKYFEKVISQELMHAFENGLHHKKGSYSLRKLNNPALGHQIPRLVTRMHAYSVRNIN